MFNLSKKFGGRLVAVCCAIFAVCSAGAAEPVQRRGGGGVQQTAAPVASAAASARAARTSAAAPATVSARSGSTPVAARSATPVVAARAASAVPMQKVMGAGTSVAAAVSTSGIVDEVCRERFFGCMDSFCMSDTNNGGRCLCSDKQSEFDVILGEIEKLDASTYKMATEGVEKIELGAKADYVFQQQQAAAKALEEDKKNADRRRTGPKLDLTQWTSAYEEFDAFGVNETADPLAGKTGDGLHTAARQMCMNSMAGCEKDIRLLQTMYSANISSDCRAFENELKRRKQSSAQKLAAAEKALRDAALESFEAANKWDLGQCTVEFRKCMMTTGGCGDDFTGCVGIAAATNAASKLGGAAQTVAIKGAKTTINIAKSSWDSLASKRPFCDSVTNNCVAAVQKDKDAVWKTFLTEIAPTIRSAELLAESDLRTNCIGNISSCFQKACKDNIDPANPDGSYDMCLTRPEALESLCKVQIDPCKAAEPMIMDFVRARLASMRVDSCTKEVRECLQSDDRCGKDYTQCIGLDTDTIVRMCPYDKLVGCQYKYQEVNVSGDAVYDELARLVQGIMLGIDNSLLSECQKAADTAMIRVCGDVSSCDDMFDDDIFGTDSLSLNSSRVDRMEIIGLVDFSQIQRTEDEGTPTLSETYGIANAAFISNAAAGVRGIVMKINSIIGMLEQDPKIQMCVNGREVQGLRTAMGQRQKIGEKNASVARTPNLLNSYAEIIIKTGLERARQNYNARLKELKKEAFAKIEEIIQKSGDISGGGMCYDKSAVGDIMK